ncbi:MAG: (Fe-S)-binding protein [Candidatus Helarchaeota archaeon]
MTDKAEKLEELEDFREDLITCGHCMGCNVFNWWTLDKWIDCCPSGKKYGFISYFAVGRIELGRALLEEEEIEPKDIESLKKIAYACPTCGACILQCKEYKEMDNVDIIEALRARMVELGYGPMSEHVKFAEATEKVNNPYGESHENRFDWLPKDTKLDEAAEIGYFVGCTSAYREQELAKATVKLLNKIGIPFQLIGSDEYCCGSPLLRTGLREKAKELAQHNVDAIQKKGVKKVIFSCAGCYRTFKEDYPKIVGNFSFEVEHISQFLDQMLKEGKLKLKNPIDKVITYHDPCHMGRHIQLTKKKIGVFDAPRNLLAAIPGITLKEMVRIRENAWCCGAGGGVKAAFKDLALETAIDRVDEACATGAEILVSACPFCRRNLMDAIKEKGSNINFKDVVELLEESIE